MYIKQKISGLSALCAVGLIASDAYALNGSIEQYEQLGSCQVRARIYNTQSADVTLQVPGDPTSGGSLYSNGRIIAFRGLTQQHIENCGFQNVSDFSTNGADSSFTADDYIGFSFNGSYSNSIGKYEVALIGANNTIVNVIKPAQKGSFYRQSNRPEVYFQYTDLLYCHVQNEWQMNAYGGFNQVNVVSQLSLKGQKTGACGWPNGFYRRENQAAVYRMSGKGVAPNIGPDICHVINEQQMAQFGGFGVVMVVPGASDLNRGRGAISKCANP